MKYADFDAERRRIVHSWGREVTDPEQLAAAVDRLRDLAPTVEGDRERDKAIRYLAVLDSFVEEARTPVSKTIAAAEQVMLRAMSPEGSPAERRARAEAGIVEIGRIGDAAPTIEERDAAHELNGTLAEIIELIDREHPDPGRDG